MLVNEIFQSISGEVGVIPQGAITWFIRFQGCNLHCSWCDTPKAQEFKGTNAYNFSPEQIAHSIPADANVVLTGGEPLLQNRRKLMQLAALLEDKNCVIQVETNGSLPSFLPICHVFDYKTPSSGMVEKMMRLELFLECSCFPETWIKFVVKSPEDLKFTIETLKNFYLLRPELLGLRIAISMESGSGVNVVVNELRKELPNILHRVVFNFQIHKLFKLR